MEIDTTDPSKLPGSEGGGEASGEGETEGMLQNEEFLHSVLSSLPGVNPEEAMQNLKEMTDAIEDQKSKDNEGETGESPVTICNIILILFFRRRRFTITELRQDLHVHVARRT